MTKKYEKLSKKKLGFTLAEVLITLGIIGIVSAMTIPTLINNYQKKVTVTRLQQTYAILNQALKLSQVDNGFMDTWKYPTEQSFETMETFVKKYILPYVKVGKTCEKSETNDCLRTETYFLDGKHSDPAGNQSSDSAYRFILQNGVAVTLYPSDAGSLISITVDINASAKPNTYGKDIFRMVMPYRVPYEYITVGKINQYGVFFLGHGFDKTTIKNGLYGTAYNCTKTNSYRVGVTCGELIRLDGWQIKDDYPW